MKEERCIHTHSGWGGDESIKVVSQFGFKRFKNKSDLGWKLCSPHKKKSGGRELRQRLGLLYYLKLGGITSVVCSQHGPPHHQSLPQFNVAPRTSAFSSMRRRKILGRFPRSSTQHSFFISQYIHKHIHIYTHTYTPHSHMAQTRYKRL